MCLLRFNGNFFWKPKACNRFIRNLMVNRRWKLVVNCLSVFWDMHMMDMDYVEVHQHLPNAMEMVNYCIYLMCLNNIVIMHDKQDMVNIKIRYGYNL